MGTGPKSDSFLDGRLQRNVERTSDDRNGEHVQKRQRQLPLTSQLLCARPGPARELSRQLPLADDCAVSAFQEGAADLSKPGRLEARARQRQGWDLNPGTQMPMPMQAPPAKSHCLRHPQSRHSQPTDALKSEIPAEALAGTGSTRPKPQGRRTAELTTCDGDHHRSRLHGHR